jgi:hypothetical protein
MMDISSSEQLYTQLNDIYSNDMAFMIQGLANPIKSSADIISVAFLDFVTAYITNSKAQTEDIAKMNRAQVRQERYFAILISIFQLPIYRLFDDFLYFCLQLSLVV